jgi:glucosamine-6-phosphate deaminase
MNIVITSTYEEMSKKAANFIISQVTLKPKSVLGLATGSTPEKTYEYIRKKYDKDEVDFAKTVTFNLDEYIGLGKEDPQSYRYFMDQHLFNHINVKEENIYIPNGLAQDIEWECINYEEEIRKHDGIDLQLLGIGRNGHIGFNEPNVNFEATTHKVSLDEDTINANARFFDSVDDVPTEAISMGIKTIMMSKKILLLASGKNKAEAIEALVNGPITPKLPASILQLHQDVTLIIDEGAASQLKLK